MGLVPRISNIVRCRTPKTLNEAINIAISEEKIQQSFLKHIPSSSRPDKPSPRPFFTRRTQNPSYSNPNNFNRENRHTNPPDRYPNANSSNNLFCRYCKIPGHTLEQCRKRQFNNNRYRNQNQPRVNFVSDESYYNNPDVNPDPNGYDTVDISACDDSHDTMNIPKNE